MPEDKSQRLRITPADFSSAAIRRVEYPGRNITNFCPSGVTGIHSAHASQPPAGQDGKQQKCQKLAQVGNSLDEEQVVGRWSLVVGLWSLASNVGHGFARIESENRQLEKTMILIIENPRNPWPVLVCQRPTTNDQRLPASHPSRTARSTLPPSDRPLLRGV